MECYRRKEGGRGKRWKRGRKEVAVQEPVSNSVREETSRPVNVRYLTPDPEVKNDVISHRPLLGLNHVMAIVQTQHGSRQISRVGR